jgi:hypothetical protein
VATPTPVLSESEIATLFSNLKALCLLHGEFYGKLRDSISASPSSSGARIGDIFSLFAPRMLQAYTPYMANFGSALSFLNADLLWKRVEWIHFFRNASQSLPDLNLTGLGHFLSQPFYRLPRYVLLLERLVAHTDTTHPDADTLRSALEAVSDISQELERTSASIMEPMRQLLSLDASIVGLSHSLVDTTRQFVQRGDALLMPLGHISRTKSSRGTNVHLLLFSDVLVVAKARKRVSAPRSSDSDSFSHASAWRYRAIFSVALFGAFFGCAKRGRFRSLTGSQR